MAGWARSTFFYHQARFQADPQAALKTALKENLHEEPWPVRAPPHHTELLKQGWRTAKKTVLKMMRVLGLACKVRRWKRYISYRGEQGAVAPDLPNREFEATAPSQKWVSDVTEFSVGDRKLYLSPDMDLFDRQIISHSIGTSPKLALTNSSLREALTCFQPDQQPLVHLDQGFQYQHASWRALLEKAGALQSMSRKANCYDNSVMENFFGHLRPNWCASCGIASPGMFHVELVPVVGVFHVEQHPRQCFTWNSLL